MAIDKQLRRAYYNRCNPDEPLDPDDDRNVDVDADSREPRGRNWVDALANKIELSDKPVCEFFTGLPGSGKSTELRRLAVRLAHPDNAHLLPVLIDAEDVLDIYNPIDVPDILIAILYKTDEAVLAAEGKDPKHALKDGRFRRFWHWLTTTEVELKSVEVSAGAEVEVPGLAKVEVGAQAVVDLKTNPSLRDRVRKKVAEHMTTFIKEVEAEIKLIQDRAIKCDYKGMVVVVDSLEKLRGISTNWSQVLMSAERVFTGGAPYLRLPIHVVYTLPPALVLRLHVSVHFLPMLKLVDRDGERAGGFSAAWAIIRKRVPEEGLIGIFGAEAWEIRVERLIAWTGGYPREIVRLLQLCSAESVLDDSLFTRLLSMAADEYRRTVPDNAFGWLAKVSCDKRLSIESDDHRATVDLMLQNNIVLRYQNDEPWVDLHPAVRGMPEVQEEIDRLAEDRSKRTGRSG